MPEGAVRHDRPVLGDPLDQGDDVLALDVVDRAPVPLRQNDLVKDVSGLPLVLRARPFLDVLRDERRRPCLNRVRSDIGGDLGGLGPGVELEDGRIIASLDVEQRGGSGRARLRQGEARIERELL